MGRESLARHLVHIWCDKMDCEVNHCGGVNCGNGCFTGRGVGVGIVVVVDTVDDVDGSKDELDDGMLDDIIALHT